MVANSKIEWTTHTFNAWYGCSKVSMACDFCYAESWAKRSGLVEWEGDRRRSSAAYWREPLKWNAAAASAGRVDTVFCLSLGDIWDNEADPVWRRDLFELIEKTPSLIWLLLSKRIGNAIKMCSATSGGPGLPRNVALGATMINQPEWDRDAPKLQRAKEFFEPLFTFASIEPILGHINIGENTPDWIIAGGESGPHARPWSIQWARSLRDQSQSAGVPFFWKQHGEWAPAGSYPSETPGRFAFGDYEYDRSVMVTTDRYPRQFTMFGARSLMEWKGKKTAGALLDGVEHKAFPI